MYLSAVLMALMLSALEVLQIFWTYHIITSFIEVNVSSKIAKHTYDWYLNLKKTGKRMECKKLMILLRFLNS